MTKSQDDAHWPDAQAAAAEERGAARLASEPQAVSARYDRVTDRVVIELSNGASFAFPPRMAEELRDAAPDDLDAVEIVADGLALHWPRSTRTFSSPNCSPASSAHALDEPTRRPRRPEPLPR